MEQKKSLNKMASDSIFIKMKDNFNNKIYFVLGVSLLLLLPFIVGVSNFVKIPIITELYSVLRDNIGFIGANEFIFLTITSSLIFGIFAASWDLLSGYTGQFNFGHALFLGMSAYLGFIFVNVSYNSTFIFDNYPELYPLTRDFAYSIQNVLNYFSELGYNIIISPIEALILGALFSALFAIFLGWISLRSKGPYFALITLIAPIIIGEAIKSIELFPGRNASLQITPILTKNSAGGLDYYYLIYFLIFLFSILGIVVLVSYSGGKDFIGYKLDKKFNNNTFLTNLGTYLFFSLIGTVLIIFSYVLFFVFDILGFFNFTIDISNVILANEVSVLNFYVIVLIAFLISVGIMLILSYSRFGDILLAIREDEEAAESLGISLTKYKILAFFISAFFAGIAGGLLAQHIASVGSSFFAPLISFKVIIMVILGGIGTIYGGVVGAFIITILINLFLFDVFKNLQGMEVFILGAVLIVVLLYLPNGITRAKKDEKNAIIYGILLSLSWILLSNTDIWLLDFPTSIFMAIAGILTLPAIPIFIISEEIGFFFFNNVINLGIEKIAILKAKFLIDLVVAIPYAFYLPKIFKKVRLKFWGTWPSVGIYEPDN